VIRTDGIFGWGDGTAVVDTNLYRSGAGVLKTDGIFTSVGPLLAQGGASVTGTLSATSSSPTTTLVTKNTNVNGSGISVQVALSSSSVFTTIIPGDSHGRVTMDGTGRIDWGDGVFVVDANLYRSAVGTLKTDGTFNAGTALQVNGVNVLTTASGDASRVLKAGDTMTGALAANGGITLTAGNTIVWATDTNLYRLGANTLKTDSSLVVAGGLTAAGASAINNVLTVTSGGAVGAQINGGVLRVFDPTVAFRSDIQMSSSGASFNSVNASNGNLMSIVFSGSDYIWNASTTNIRALALSATGVMSFGTTGDTNLYRSAVGTLKTDGTFNAVAGLQVNGVNVLTTATGDNSRVLKVGDTMTGALAMTMSTSTYALAINNGVSGSGISATVGGTVNTALSIAVTSDSSSRYSVDGTGKTAWGTGALSTDTNLYRSAVGTLKTDNSLLVNTRMAVGGVALDVNTDLNVAKNITDPTGAQTGIAIAKQVHISANNTQTSAALTALQTTSGTPFNYLGTLRGTYAQVQFSGTGTASVVSASESLLYNVGSGTITDGSAITATIQNLNAAGVITSAYGLKIQLALNSGTIANTYGVYVGDVTSGTQTNQAYGVYVSDANARNFFAGPIAVGTTSVNSGTGSPEGVVAAPVGSLYARADGGVNSTLYSKTTGATSTGWTALGSSATTSPQVQLFTLTSAEPYTVLGTDNVVLASGSTVTVNLPSASTLDGRLITVKNITAVNITVKSAAGTIDGIANTTGIVLVPNQTATFLAASTNWWIVDGAPPPTPNVQTFTASGTWTKPLGARAVWVRAVGGGGAGAGAVLTAAGTSSCGGGGGGAGYGEITTDSANVTATVAVTIGLGGTGISGAPGNAGGTSSFGLYLTATGGGSGLTNTSGTPTSCINGGNGGSAAGTLSPLITNGSPGGWGIRSSGLATSGMGGDSALGGGAPPWVNNPQPGQPGNNYGGGGAGATSQAGSAAAIGGAGAPGVVIVTTYF